MDISPLSFLREELQETFNVLFEEFVKIVKRNKELQKSLKEVTFKKEVLKQ